MNATSAPSRKLLWIAILLLPLAFGTQLFDAALTREEAKIVEGSSPKHEFASEEERFAEDEYFGVTLDRRPIYARDDRVYVWANGRANTPETEWFDMTDSTLDPAELKHGVGKDAIASIDHPVFLKPGDPKLDTWVHPRLRGMGARPLSDTSPVIGVEIDGEARAYPLTYLSSHELVNDVFGEAHVTVAW